MLQDGLYEQIISNAIDDALAAEPVATEKQVETKRLDEAEAPKMLTQYISGILEQALESLDDDKESLKKQIELANKLVSIISESETASDLSIADRTEQLLLEIRDRKNSALAIDDRSKTPRPETSIAQTSLFTGAIHEPQMYTELKKEILSCSHIDMLVSFVK